MKFDPLFKDLLELPPPTPPASIFWPFSQKKVPSASVVAQKLEAWRIRFSAEFQAIQINNQVQDLVSLQSLAGRIKPKLALWEKVPETSKAVERLSTLFTTVSDFKFPGIRHTRSTPTLAHEGSRTIDANISPRLVQEAEARRIQEQLCRQKADAESKAQAEKALKDETDRIEKEEREAYRKIVRQILQTAQSQTRGVFFLNELAAVEYPKHLKVWGEELTGFQVAQIAARALEPGQEVYRPKLVYLIGSLKPAEFADFFTFFPTDLIASTREEMQETQMTLKKILHGPCFVVHGKTNTRIFYPGMPIPPQGKPIDDTKTVHQWMKQQLDEGILARLAGLSIARCKEVNEVKAVVTKDSLINSPEKIGTLTNNIKKRVENDCNLFDLVAKLFWNNTLTPEALVDGSSMVALMNQFDALRNALKYHPKIGIWSYLDTFLSDQLVDKDDDLYLEREEFPTGILSKLEVFTVYNYKEVGLLANVTESQFKLCMQGLGQMEARPSLLFARGKQNLELLGLRSNEDFKKHLIFSKTRMQDFCKENEHLLKMHPFEIPSV